MGDQARSNLTVVDLATGQTTGWDPQANEGVFSMTATEEAEFSPMSTHKSA